MTLDVIDRLKFRWNLHVEEGLSTHGKRVKFPSHIGPLWPKHLPEKRHVPSSEMYKWVDGDDDDMVQNNFIDGDILYFYEL